MFDPAHLPPEDYGDALQREWAAEEERRKAARAAGQGRVEFTKSGACVRACEAAGLGWGGWGGCVRLWGCRRCASTLWKHTVVCVW